MERGREGTRRTILLSVEEEEEAGRGGGEGEERKGEGEGEWEKGKRRGWWFVMLTRGIGKEAGKERGIDEERKGNKEGLKDVKYINIKSYITFIHHWKLTTFGINFNATTNT